MAAPLGALNSWLMHVLSGPPLLKRPYMKPNLLRRIPCTPLVYNLAYLLGGQGALPCEVPSHPMKCPDYKTYAFLGAARYGKAWEHNIDPRHWGTRALIPGTHKRKRTTLAGHSHVLTLNIQSTSKLRSKRPCYLRSFEPKNSRI